MVVVVAVLVSVVSLLSLLLFGLSAVDSASSSSKFLPCKLRRDDKSLVEFFALLLTCLTPVVHTLVSLLPVLLSLPMLQFRHRRSVYTREKRTKIPLNKIDPSSFASTKSIHSQHVYAKPTIIRIRYITHGRLLISFLLSRRRYKIQRRRDRAARVQKEERHKEFHANTIREKTNKDRVDAAPKQKRIEPKQLYLVNNSVN